MVATIAGIVRSCDDEVIGEGCDWYDGRAPAEIRQIAKDTGTTYGVAAGMLAVANTNASWSGSLTLARKFATQAAEGRPISGGMGPVLEKAQRIANGEKPTAVLTSNKIGRFYRNMTGNHEVVTVDRWAARAAGAEHMLGRKGGYEAIEAAYIDAAHEVGLPPAMCQAVVWVAIRGTAA